MSPLARTVIVLVAVAVMLAIVLFLLRDDERPCPDGQVPVLTTDKWICVTKGD